MKKDSADDEIILFCLYSLLLSSPVLSVEISITDSLCQMIGASKLTDYNSFEKPNIVKPAPFKEVKINKGTMKVKLPAKSIVTLELQ